MEMNRLRDRVVLPKRGNEAAVAQIVLVACHTSRISDLLRDTSALSSNRRRESPEVTLTVLPRLVLRRCDMLGDEKATVLLRVSENLKFLFDAKMALRTAIHDSKLAGGLVVLD